MSAKPAGVTISEATEVSPELVEAFERLIPQLSSSSPPPGTAELAEIVASPASVLLVARDGSGAIVGSLTLALFRVPTGLLAWIEDVVVDESARGVGAGEALVHAAIDRADAAGAKTVDLTSRPSREAANRLYRRVGFELRTTNVYRWSAGSAKKTTTGDGTGPDGAGNAARS
jgi:ribosomal protein S18 acetylase RimI-like enzyme